MTVRLKDLYISPTTAAEHRAQRRMVRRYMRRMELPHDRRTLLPWWVAALVIAAIWWGVGAVLR